MLAAALLAATLAAAPATAPGTAPDAAPTAAMAVPNADMLARGRALGREIRCPVCQGMPVGESPAQMARDMQARIDQLVAQGHSDAQVRDWFVQRYGTWVLLDPPRHGITSGLFVLPVALVVAAAAVVAGTLRRLRRRPPPSPSPSPPDDDRLAAIRREAQW